MPKLVVAYLGAAVALLVLDALWLGLVMAQYYKAQLGQLMLEQPRWAAAGLFYALYLVGVTALCTWPALQAESLGKALWMGALLGLVAYGTYDLTNLATLKGWSASLVAIDMAWGTFITAAAAGAGFLAARSFGR